MKDSEFLDKGLRMLCQGSQSFCCSSVPGVGIGTYKQLLMKRRGIFFFLGNTVCAGALTFPVKEKSVLVSITAGHLKICIPGKSSWRPKPQLQEALSVGCSLQWWALGTCLREEN